VKVRLRLAVLMMLALLGAGSIALLVNALTFQDSTYKSPDAFQNAIFDELHVDRDVAEAYVKAHPEVLFDSSANGTPAGSAVNAAFQRVQSRVQHDAVNRSRVWTAIAIGVLAVLAGLIGWLIAGRTLRPIRLITNRARAASANDLTVRVDLHGPDDELKDLADTFDDMLDRLEHSFVAQRRFSAQVSHELRTPLAVVRSEADILIADGESDATRATAENIKNATLRAERIVSALLALGRAESGRIDSTVIALDELVGDTVAEVLEGRERQDIRFDVELHPVSVVGDRALIDCLVRNLVDNAARHNRRGGWVRVEVGADPAGAAIIEIANSTETPTVSGPASATSRSEPDGDHGIGLTVVAAAVAAHLGSFERDDHEPGTVVARVRIPAGGAVHAQQHAASSAFVTDRA
jgi:signal transduction histidine kinase